MEFKITPPAWFISAINHKLAEKRKEVKNMEIRKEWPFGFNEAETMVEVNKRMIHKLLERKNVKLTNTEERALIALGIEVNEAREEGAGIFMHELARRSGLNASFIPILEHGKALPEEITPEVLDSLATALSIQIQDLERAYSYG